MATSPALSTTVARSPSLDAFVYEIVASAPLPAIDLSKSVRTVCLNKRVAKLWTQAQRRCAKAMMGGYYIALGLYFFGLFMVADVGRCVAVVTISLGIWGALTSISVLRSDIVRLLFGMYEVWFFSVTNTLSSVLLAMYFGDLRVFLIPPVWLGVQSGIFLDANITMARHFFISSLLTIGFLVTLVAYICLGALDSVHSFVVFPSQSRAMTAEIALVNGWGTIILLLCRNVYRRRETIKKLGVESMLVQCISYRVKIKLVRVEGSPTTAVVPVPAPLSRSPIQAAMLLKAPTQLHLVTTHERFNASETMIPISRFIPVGSQAPHWLCMSVYAIALVGFVLMCVAFVAAHVATSLYTVHQASLIATGTFTTLSLGVYQRQLLRRMVFSFDYAFLSLQIIAAHIGACDLVCWDHRCLAVLSSALWVHWVLTIDAIVPVTKQQWGFRVSFVAVIMAVFILTQSMIAVGIVFDVGIAFQDHSVFDVRLWEHTIHVRTVPLLLGRLVILLSWSCRVLWRIWQHKGDDLIVMHGGVIFESWLHSRHVLIAATQVAPGTSAVQQ